MPFWLKVTDFIFPPSASPFWVVQHTLPRGKPNHLKHSWGTRLGLQDSGGGQPTMSPALFCQLTELTLLQCLCTAYSLWQRCAYVQHRWWRVWCLCIRQPADSDVPGGSLWRPLVDLHRLPPLKGNNKQTPGIAILGQFVSFPDLSLLLV